METKCLLKVTETVAPNTGRETTAGTERNWESFPQPAGWSLHWDNEGLEDADLPHTRSENASPTAGPQRPEQG
jgi:hypothetical protein